MAKKRLMPLEDGNSERFKKKINIFTVIDFSPAPANLRFSD